MPIPMIVCRICGKEVTKRSTLSLSNLGSEGRACRSHPEVLTLLEEKTTELKFGKLQDQIAKEVTYGINYYDFMDALANMQDTGTLKQPNDQLQHHITRVNSASECTITEIRKHAQDFISIWREAGLID